MKTECIWTISMNTRASRSVRRHIAISNYPFSRYIPLCGKPLRHSGSWVFERDVTPTCKKCLEIEGEK